MQKTAQDADIHKAYKKLALKHHPDKNPENKEQAEENFKKISEAYDVLRDPEKRKNYDEFGKDGPQQMGGTGGMSGNSMSREDADRLFKMFFPGGEDPFAMFNGSTGGSGMTGGVHRTVFRSGHGFQDGDSFGMGFGDGPFGVGVGGMGRMGGAFGRRTGIASRGRPGCQAPACVLPNGTAVVVRGLTKAPEHNAKSGTVVGWDVASSRYNVNLDGKRLSLRPRNLTQVCHAELTGLEKRPELNGRIGEIFGYDDEKQRYIVYVKASGVVAMKCQPGNCVLEKGTRVVMQNLSAAQFNGQMAQVVGVDRAAERYIVQVQNGEQIKIRYENVLC